MVNWKGCRRKWPELDVRACLSIYMEWLRKTTELFTIAGGVWIIQMRITVRPVWLPPTSLGGIGSVRVTLCFLSAASNINIPVMLNFLALVKKKIKNRKI
jgi:hypothetical protein